MKGNEKDCICEKFNNKHRKHCDAYRLSEFLIKVSGLDYTNPMTPLQQKLKEQNEEFNKRFTLAVLKAVKEEIEEKKTDYKTRKRGHNRN